MNDSARTQGVLICIGAVALGLLFGIGLLSGAWWAVAIPVAVLLTFVLGLTFWVGWTIATVQIEPETPPAADPGEGAGASDSSA
ncbi:MAG: hypothetical protein OEP95_00445 [Myxococcales bacterium]|nr:hypothetical protein [Myxococcales bacterium]